MNPIKLRSFHNGRMNYDASNKDEGDITIFIGSKDRNGYEIYTGDLLECPSGMRCVVFYNDENLQFQMKNSSGNIFNINCQINKIVGDIFQHPELF